MDGDVTDELDELLLTRVAPGYTTLHYLRVTY